MSGAQDSLMISASLPAWQRAIGALQILTVLAFAVVLMRPLDVPDPLNVGPGLSWSLICLVTAVAVMGLELFAGGWPSTGLDRPLLAYVALVGLATLTSVDRTTSLVWIVSLAGNIGVFAAIVVAARKADWLADALLLFLVADIALLLLLATGYHAEVGFLARPKGYPIPEGWSGYPELSALGAVQFALLVGAVQTARNRWLMVCGATLAAITLAEAALLYARGVWVAVAAVLAASVSLLVGRSGSRRAMLAVAIVLAIAVPLVLLNPTLRFLVFGGPRPSGPALDVAAPEMRMRIYQRTLGLIAAHPLTGTGPGNYQRVFEAAYPPDISAEGRSGAHAHNLWLHQYAELGLAGGSAYVLLWVWILWLAWRRARAAPNFQSVSLLLALAAMVGSNLTTHMFYQTGLAAGRLHTLLWILVGLVAAPVTASGLRREPGNPDV